VEFFWFPFPLEPGSADFSTFHEESFKGFAAKDVELNPINESAKNNKAMIL
jgi:hypothetical protein